jgi:hypothetical protein
MTGASARDDDFGKYLGERVQVETNDGRTFVGKVTDLDGDRIEITTPTGPEWFERTEIMIRFA